MPTESQEHPKHLQLGTDLENNDRTPLAEEDRDSVWEDATTVEQFKEDIELLAELGGLE